MELQKIKSLLKQGHSRRASIKGRTSCCCHHSGLTVTLYLITAGVIRSGLVSLTRPVQCTCCLGLFTVSICSVWMLFMAIWWFLGYFYTTCLSPRVSDIFRSRKSINAAPSQRAVFRLGWLPFSIGASLPCAGSGSTLTYRSIWDQNQLCVSALRLTLGQSEAMKSVQVRFSWFWQVINPKSCPSLSWGFARFGLLMAGAITRCKTTWDSLDYFSPAGLNSPGTLGQTHWCLWLIFKYRAPFFPKSKMYLRGASLCAMKISQWWILKLFEGGNPSHWTGCRQSASLDRRSLQCLIIDSSRQIMSHWQPSGQQGPQRKSLKPW